jgi:hypothetical protein
MNHRQKRDWSNGWWIKQHVHEPANDLLAPLMQRALRDYLRKRAEPDGSLIVNRDDPLGSLIRVLGAHEPELGMARQALAALVDQGILETDGRSIWMPERVESQVRSLAVEDAESPAMVAPANQKPTSTSRVRAHRERKRNERNALAGVSPRPAGATRSVSSPSSGGVSAHVPPSRGFSEQNPAHSLGDQKDQKDHRHHPEEACARPGVSSSVASDEASETDEDEDEDELRNEVGRGSSDERCAEPEQAPRGPGSLAEALRLDVAKRSALLMDRAELAEALRPDQWPEVRAVAEAFALARGRPSQPLGRYAQDNAVRLAVALYAAGYPETDLIFVVRAIANQEWAKDKALGSLLTFKVVDANRPKPLVKTEANLSPRAALALARAREAQRSREAG